MSWLWVFTASIAFLSRSEIDRSVMSAPVLTKEEKTMEPLARPSASICVRTRILFPCRASAPISFERAPSLARSLSRSGVAEVTPS